LKNISDIEEEKYYTYDCKYEICKEIKEYIQYGQNLKYVAYCENEEK